MLKIKIMPAKPEDCIIVWKWRNDPTTRKYSFNTRKIPYAEHSKWFSKILTSKKNRLFMLIHANKKIGCIRFDLFGKGVAEIHINLDPAQRGRGLGIPSIKESCNYAFGKLKINKIIAKIKPSNKRSIHAFSKAGFSIIEKNVKNKVIKMILNKNTK